MANVASKDLCTAWAASVKLPLAVVVAGADSETIIQGCHSHVEVFFRDWQTLVVNDSRFRD